MCEVEEVEVVKKFKKSFKFDFKFKLKDKEKEKEEKKLSKKFKDLVFELEFELELELEFNFDEVEELLGNKDKLINDVFSFWGISSGKKFKKGVWCYFLDFC